MSQITRQRYSIIFVVLLLFTISGCAGITKRLESPTIQIADIKVKEIKALEASFNVQLRVINPNDISITAKGLNCDVELNEIHLATGVSGATVEIPAFGTAIVPIEIYSSAFDIVKSIIALSNKEVSKYRIKGKLRLEGGSFLLPSIPFESEGEINVKGLMEKK
jgi:LEA14-like dessication related protein